MIRKRAADADPKSHPVPYHADLDTPLLEFGKGEAWTIRAAAESVAVFGAPGSGKSSGAGRAFASAFLSAGMGGLVLCAKVEEAEVWRRYAAACGRQADLVVIDETARHRFNILDYAAATIGRPGFERNLVSLMERMAEAARVADDKGGGSDKEGRYYYDTASRWLGSAFPLLLLAYGSASMKQLYDMVSSAPTSMDEVRKELANITSGKQQGISSFCLQTVYLAGEGLKAKAAKLRVPPTSLPEAGDFDIHAEVWTDEIPSADKRERSIVSSILRNLTGAFSTGKLRELFCTDTTVTPEDARAGKVIVIDLPALRFGPTGIVAQTVFKYLFGIAMQSKPVTANTRPVFIWADEAQFFISSADDDLLSTARSSKICLVYLTQDLPTYYARIGKDTHDKAEAVLSKFGTRIFLANTSRETNLAASEIIGKEFQEEMVFTTSDSRDKRGGSSRHDDQAGFDGGRSRTQGESQTRQQRYEFAVPPDVFAWRLRTGGPRNKFKVDAIVIRNGATWKSTGRHWLQAEFSQR
ncbi:TraM-binding TraD/TraG-like protein [Nitrospirillum amazonense]|uniref:TraM-binding TraD/TraG-like protein n=1 Tax=Nitrospirillum amazonense TaxID=28077 RepID=A0A560F1N9_9PROT|nr:TraM recognition domain-containing protein [Nitrospirillum amazonense]TWB15542.1 TraM-binding TraD/TraG-like protein [Nitrospirillum amazonense]